MTGEHTQSTGILEEMTIEDVKQFDPEVVVLGIGSTEPHGPHLPYGTDVFQAEAVCRRSTTQANQRGARVLMYPTLPISNNVNFKAYPFACRVRVRTLMNVVLDVIDALEQEGIRKIVIVNGHLGNTDTLRATLREHAGRNTPDEGAFVCLTDTFRAVPDAVTQQIEHPSDHGGEGETSRMLHLRPDLVREEHFDAFPEREPIIEELDAGGIYFVPPWHAYLPESAGGETAESSEETGQALIDGAAEWIADVLVALHEAEVNELFPYSGIE